MMPRTSGENIMGDVVTVARPKRPLSVWLAAAINTALAIILLATSFKGGDWAVPAPQIAFWAVLGLAIWISTLSAWWGSRWGRNVMLVLVTFYLGSVLVAAVPLIGEASYRLDNDAIMLRLSARVAISLAFLVANYWLVFSKRARSWFA